MTAVKDVADIHCIQFHFYHGAVHNSSKRRFQWSSVMLFKSAFTRYVWGSPSLFDSLILLQLRARLLLTSPSGLYRFHEDMGNMVQVLEAPLWGDEASLVLLMPFHVEDLDRLEKLLTVELLAKWLEKTNVTSVAISLPRANISSTLSLQVSTTLRVLYETIC